MNQTALLGHNALSAHQSFSASTIQELLNALGERDATIAKLEELVRAKDAELEQLRPKMVGQ